MKERLNALRKKLRLTQEDMGRKLGVTRAAISRLESGGRNLTDQMIVSICREFSVNEEWLRYGTGDMFMETEDSVISELSHKYSLDDLDRSIIETYLRLDKHDRKIIKDYIYSVVENVDKKNKKDSYSYDLEENDEQNSRLSLVAEDGAEYTVGNKDDYIANEVESYRLELEAETKGKTSSASEDSKSNSKSTKANKIS